MKIICIGRNYHSHIDEFAYNSHEKPFFFFKPDSALLLKNRPFFLPDFSAEIHYEVELLVHICKVGKHIQPKFAHTYYDAIGLGIDMTARDLQRQCKEQGLPWEIAKGFDGAAVVSNFLKKEMFANMHSLNFHLTKNGQCVQQANSSEMIMGIDEIIAYISKFITLKIGDIIFTGTPAGVGILHINDHLEGYIEKEKLLDFYIK